MMKFEKKSLLVGCFCGFIIGSFLCWLLIVEYPLLLTDQSKGSYAIGYRLGQSAGRHNTNLNSAALTGGMLDGLKNTSRLSDEEIQLLFKEMRNQSHRKRPHHAGIGPQVGTVDSDGFMVSPRRYLFKILSEKPDRMKDFETIMSRAKREPVYTYSFKILDPSNKEIYKSSTLKGDRTQTARVLFDALSYVEENESIQIKKLNDVVKLEIQSKYNLDPALLNGNFIIQIKRH